MEALKKFLLPIEILPYEEEAALCYGAIRETLEKRGKLIGPMDLMIAAHAQSLGVVLVINNTKNFSRVSDLSVENWARRS